MTVSRVEQSGQIYTSSNSINVNCEENYEELTQGLSGKQKRDYEKVQKRKEELERTTCYIDKAKYEEAEKERKALRKQKIEQYMNEGLSKSEAKKKADAELPINIYLSDSVRARIARLKMPPLRSIRTGVAVDAIGIANTSEQVEGLPLGWKVEKQDE